MYAILMPSFEMATIRAPAADNGCRSAVRISKRRVGDSELGANARPIRLPPARAAQYRGRGEKRPHDLWTSGLELLFLVRACCRIELAAIELAPIKFGQGLVQLEPGVADVVETLSWDRFCRQRRNRRRAAAGVPPGTSSKLDSVRP